MRAQSGSIAGDRIEQLHVNAQAQHMTLVNPRAGAMIRSRHDAPAFARNPTALHERYWKSLRM